MRALIVSDIHSNLEALQSVIDHANGNGGFHQIWQLGDLVGYGPDPGGCIDLLREYDHIGVAGNHDMAAVGRLGLEQFNTYAATAARWTRTQLSDEQIDYLGKLPLRVETNDFTAVHGSPRDPVWEYVVSTYTATANLGHFITRRCLVGHSHLPFICKFRDTGAEFLDFPLNATIALGSERCIINPGKCRPAARRRADCQLRGLRLRRWYDYPPADRVRYSSHSTEDEGTRLARVLDRPAGGRPIGRHRAIMGKLPHSGLLLTRDPA